MAEGGMYDRAIAIVDEAVAKGPFSLDELVLSSEMRYAILYVSERELKRKKARDILDKNKEGLFMAACDVMRESAGACSPRDAARGMVMSFIRCGMDLDKARAFAGTRLFAEMKF